MKIAIPPAPLAILAAVLAGLLNLFSKNLLNAGFTPIEVCALREGVTAVVFALILLIVDRSAFRINPRHIWLFALFGAFNVASNLCVFTAQQSLPLEVAAVLEMTSPYFILVFSFFLFGDRITRRKVLAAMLAFIGCIFIIGLFNSQGDFKVGGITAGVLSGITLAAFTLGGKYMGDKGYSENTAMFYFFAFSALLIAPLTNFVHIGNMVSADMSLLPAIIAMGVLCTLAPNYLVIYTVRRMDPAAVSIIITSSLIVSTLVGIIFFGDPFGFHDVVGIVLIMAAIIILDPPKALKERFGRLEDDDESFDADDWSAR